MNNIEEIVSFLLKEIKFKDVLIDHLESGSDLCIQKLNLQNMLAIKYEEADKLSPCFWLFDDNTLIDFAYYVRVPIDVEIVRIFDNNLNNIPIEYDFNFNAHAYYRFSHNPFPLIYLIDAQSKKGSLTAHVLPNKNKEFNVCMVGLFLKNLEEEEVLELISIIKNMNITNPSYEISDGDIKTKEKSLPELQI